MIKGFWGYEVGLKSDLDYVDEESKMHEDRRVRSTKFRDSRSDVVRYN